MVHAFGCEFEYKYNFSNLVCVVWIITCHTSGKCRVPSYAGMQLEGAGILGTPRGGVGGWGILPYMSYIGMCSPKGYGFSAALVINRVLILAILLPFWQ